MSSKNIKRISIAAAAVLSVALVATLFLPAIKGGKRWLNILGFSVQPSEFLKPVMAVVTAMMLVKIKELAAAGDSKGMKRGIGALAAMFAVVTAVLLLQPDLGMTLAFLAILAAEAFVAGLPWKWVGALAFLAAALIFGAYFSSPHVASRIDRFVFSENSDTYQIDAGLNTIRRAGLFGAQENNLKKSVPDVHTDFIFSAMVEEFGMLLAILVVSVFFRLGARVFSRLKEKRDPFAVYAVFGITSCMMFQVCVNLASTLGLIPTKGMTLPFISYGGSSFISSCLSIGIILALFGERGEWGKNG
jgi:cell division protein FtsW